MEYVHDSEIIVNKKNVSVNIASINSNPTAMRDASQVTEIKVGGLSAILGTEKYKVSIGKGEILEDIPQLMLKSLAEESHRSGIFLLNSITLDKLAVDGKFTFFDKRMNAGSSSSPLSNGNKNRQIAYPALSQCQLTMVLKKDDEIVLSQNINQSFCTERVTNQKHFSSTLYFPPDIYEQYADNMAQALSRVINTSIRETVHHINTYLMQNEDDLVTIKEISIDELVTAQLAAKVRKYPSSYLNFNIIGGEMISGILANADKENYYVTDMRTLITIKKTSVMSITDNKLNVLSDDDLTSENFQRINYNNFSEFREIER